MLATLSLAPATPTDIPALVALVNSAYRGAASRRGWTTEADLLDGQRTDAADVLALLAPPEATILLATTADGQLRGCVYLRQQASALYVGMLSVAPTQQGLGTGKHLLQAAETHAQQAGCTHLRITVIAVRTELIAWYERHGYRKTGETEPFPADSRFGVPRQPLELLVMQKVLPRFSQ